MPSEMTLVGKPGGQGDFRQRQLSLTEHVLNVLEAPLQQISVRRHSNRFSESTCEMVRGKPCHGSETAEANLLIEMRFDVFANSVCSRGAKASAARGRRVRHVLGDQHTQPGLGDA